MLRLTDGPLAPWDVISSEHKRHGRVEVIETVIRRIEAGMARMGLAVPPSDAEALKNTEMVLAADDADAQVDHAAPEDTAADAADGPAAAEPPDPTPTDTPGTRIDA
jgi:hypothetical protein